MKVPPRGDRYVAANWIALGMTVVWVLVGTIALLLVRDPLPDRIAISWDGAVSTAWLSLGQLLVVAPVAVLGSFLLLVGVAWAVRRSVRHGMSQYALYVSTVIGAVLYGATWAQRDAHDVDPAGWLVLGTAVGAATLGALRWWTRPSPAPAMPATAPPDATATARTTAAVPGLELPVGARVAWVGEVKMPLAARACIAALVMIPWFLLCAWFGSLGSLGLAGALIVVMSLWSTRGNQFRVDYSGAGFSRSSTWLPSPIQMAEISGAEMASVSAVRDFGWWGRVKSPTGAEGWITRSGEALVIHRWHKPDFVITIDDAAHAAAVLNTLLARSKVG